MADPLAGGAEEKQTWVYDANYLDGGYWKSDAHPGLRWSSTLQNWVTQPAPEDLAPAKSSGGGSTSPTNVYITQNPGELYQTVVSDGNDGYAAGTVYQVNQLTGAVTVKSRPSTTASLWDDVNGDGYDDQTGLPNGVARLGNELYFQGNRVNPDGSLYTGPDDAALAPTWTGYGPRGQGTYRLDGPGGTPGTYIGPTTAAGAGISTSSGGGSSGGGSSAGGGLTSPANRTNTTIHEGGFNDVRTTTNISEIGPLEAAIRASEFAANNALARDKRQMELAALYSQQLRDTDPNAYQVFLEKMGGGRLDNALLSGGNALSENALRGAATSLGALNGMNTPAQAGGGLTSGANPTGGGDPSSPGGGLPGTPAQPAATPAATGPVYDRNAMLADSAVGQWNQWNQQTPEQTAYNALHAGQQGAIMQGDYGGNPVDLRRFNALSEGIMSGRFGGTQTLDPSRAGYVDERPDSYPSYLVDPRIAAQAGDDIQRMAPAQLPYSNDDIQRQIPQRAGGGLTRGPAIVGDPQANGRPNPEVIIPHDPRMTYDVVPLQDMPPMMAMRAMGGLQRHAYGTPTPEQQAYFAAHPEEDNPFAPAPQPVASQPASQPVAAQQPATATATTQPANNPAQIGTYSTAPGTAGQPVAQPVAQPPQTTAPAQVQPTSTQPAQNPVTTPTAALVSGASGGSTQPSQAAFDEVMYQRLAATNPWMTDPTAFNNVDYLTRDPIARRNFEQWLTVSKGVPQESIDFAIAKSRLGGASMASMSQGR